ncbi:hypothetical protein ABKA04_006465 [Annulohypoxylon sp. FPYF3050]
MSNPTDPALKADGTEVCHCCFDPYPKTDLYELDCLHKYCSNCIRTIFTTSFEQEGNFPPHCCDDTIHLTPRLVALLGKDVWSVYIAKRAEYKPGKRIYCSNTGCGSFISVDYRFNHFAICQKCDALTCTKCRNPCHEGDCPADDGSSEVKKLAKDQGWVECPKCGTVIEKAAGCDAIRCSCGEDICYQCSNSLRKCSCQMRHERFFEAIERAGVQNDPALHQFRRDEQRRAERDAVERDAMEEIRQRYLAKYNGRKDDKKGGNDGGHYTYPSSLPTVQAPPTTTSQSIPPPYQHTETQVNCHHRFQKAVVNGVDMCPECRRATFMKIHRWNEERS